MVRAEPERLRDHFLQLQFDRQRRLALGEPSAVADAEDVRVDRERLLPEGAVEHDVGGLAPDAGQPLQRVAVLRHLAAAEVFGHLGDPSVLAADVPNPLPQSLVSELREFNLPDDYWDKFRDAIEGVGAEQALEAAQRYIRPGQSTLVVVGKAAAFKSALEAYGPVTVVDTAGNVLVKP